MLENAITYEHPIDILEPEDEAQDETLDVSEIGRVPVDALRVFVQFLIPDRTPTNRWQTALTRLVALAHAIQADGVRELSLTQLAEELGCSRALLSLHACNLRDAASLDSRSGKSSEARAVYSQRAKHIWQTRQNRARAEETTLRRQGKDEGQTARHADPEAKDGAMGDPTTPHQEVFC